MNLCHCVLPSPLGKQRMHVCRKSGLFPLTVRSKEKETRRIWHHLTQITKPHTGSFMWFVQCEKVIHILKNSNQAPRSDTQCNVSVGCWGKRITVDANKATSSETQVKQNTVSFTGLLFQELAGFPLRGWELTTSLHPIHPALFFSVGWDRRYQCELDSRHLQRGDV